VWKIDRPKEINWVTPTLRMLGDRAEIIFSSPKESVAYSAVDGKRTWSLASPGPSVPTAVITGDRVLLPVGAGVTLLKPDGNKMSEVWNSPKLASGYTSPMIYKDHVYAINRAGSLICCDLKNGREVWTERIVKGKGQFWASPIAADDKIYTFDDAGNGTVVQAGGETAKVLATNEMKTEILGTPAIANGAMYIQTVNAVYCIAAKK
jgi:outer membrane protein assembly factor BamB